MDVPELMAEAICDKQRRAWDRIYSATEFAPPRDTKQRIRELEAALKDLLDAYVGVADCYDDWGVEGAEAESVVVRARAALAGAPRVLARAGAASQEGRQAIGNKRKLW